MQTIPMTRAICREAKPTGQFTCSPCGKRATRLVWHEFYQQAVTMCTACAEKSVSQGNILIAVAEGEKP